MASPDDQRAMKEDSCLRRKLPPVHIIFPWKTRPANPANAIPSWKCARNAQVQTCSAAHNWAFTFPEGNNVRLINKIRLAVNSLRSPDGSIHDTEPKALSAAELHRLYAGTSVPRHRYLAPSLTEAVNSPEIAPHPAKWLAEIPGIDLSSVVDEWLNTNRSTEYEQLYLIGLDLKTSQLTGVLKVKQGSGYSGGPGTAGSIEYVAFWVDCGLGFQYEGTAMAAVHDFNRLPPAGLEYSVSLPFDLLSLARRCGEGAKTVKVRAVLCWNTPPSTTDPNAPVVWGNILESRIPLPPIQALRAGDQSLAAGGAAELVQADTDGLIVDAAIKALAGEPIDSHVGLTVALGSAIADHGATGRIITIDTSEMDDRGCSFSLYLWDRANRNRGAASSPNHPSTESLLASEKLAGSTGFPQTRTESAARIGLRPRPPQEGETSR
jgi:hypothetical protein